MTARSRRRALAPLLALGLAGAALLVGAPAAGGPPPQTPPAPPAWGPLAADYEIEPGPPDEPAQQPAPTTTVPPTTVTVPTTELPTTTVPTTVPPPTTTVSPVTIPVPIPVPIPLPLPGRATECLAVSGPVPREQTAVVAGIRVHPCLASRVTAMADAAATQGVRLTGGGWRSHERQIELRRAHCGTTDYAIWEMPSGRCKPPTARPGRSMHERGLAVDFNNCSTRETACWIWLNANAAGYGFFNLPSEPWHWSTDGH